MSAPIVYRRCPATGRVLGASPVDPGAAVVWDASYGIKPTLPNDWESWPVCGAPPDTTITWETTHEPWEPIPAFTY